MRHIICFHNPEEENGYLSNWYPSPFEKDGISFAHMEQYMMYQKALAISGYRNCTADFANRQPRQGQSAGAERPELRGLPVECRPGSRSSTRDCWKNSGKTSRFCKNCWQLHRICWQNVRYMTGSGASDCP